MNLGQDTVTRLRAPVIPGPDDEPIIDWDNTPDDDLDKVEYPGSSFQPLSSNENLVAQQRTESTHRWFAPAGADVVATDRVRFNGLDYQVDGEPERWRIRNREHHVEVLCFRITGG